jgi:hypothetical protein
MAIMSRDGGDGKFNKENVRKDVGGNHGIKKMNQGKLITAVKKC